MTPLIECWGNTSSKIRVERYKQKAPKKQGFLFPPAKQNAQGEKAKGKKVAQAPTIVKKQEAKNIVNPLIEKNA